MRFKQVIIGAVGIGATLAAYAEWKTLQADDGRVVEVAAEFNIEAFSVAPNGDTAIEARSAEGGNSLGFSVVISTPREGVVAQLGEEATLPILRSDLAIRSIGVSTKNLEEILHSQLGGKGTYESELRVVGLYTATACAFGGSIARPAIFIARDVGLTFDDSGSSTLGQCFALTIFVDAPMNRLIAYFSLPAGYGGTSAANRRRLQWYETQAQKGANQ